MSRSAAHTSIEATIDALKLALGEGLLAVYLYGSLSDGTYQAGQSDVNLVVVHQSPTAIHQIRDALGGEFDVHGRGKIMAKNRGEIEMFFVEPKKSYG